MCTDMHTRICVISGTKVQAFCLDAASDLYTDLHSPYLWFQFPSIILISFLLTQLRLLCSLLLSHRIFWLSYSPIFFSSTTMRIFSCVFHRDPIYFHPILSHVIFFIVMSFYDMHLSDLFFAAESLRDFLVCRLDTDQVSFG